MKKILILIFIILLLISIFKFFNFTSLFFASQKFEEYYKVIRVIDGDTFELENGEKVRLLGINAPEKGQKCYFEAKKRLEELVLNKIVKLEGNKKDKYGRLLRYVWINSTLVNLQLIKEGLAISYFFEEDNYTKIFEDAEKYARINSIGCLWQKSEANCKECIGIKIF